MNNFDQLEEAALANIVLLDRKNEDDWGFGTESSWAFSQPDGILSVQFENGSYVDAKCQVIGSFCESTASWKWGWDNRTLESHLLECSEATRKYGLNHGEEYLSAPNWECDFDFAYSLSAISVYVCNLKGLFVLRQDSTLVFLGLVEIVRRSDALESNDKPTSEFTSQDETMCQDVVLRFIRELNDWEIKEYILARLEDGMFVTPSRAKLVESETYESHFSKHARIFLDLVSVDDRTSGSMPGKPGIKSSKGTFCQPKGEAKVVTSQEGNNRAFVTTNWGYWIEGETRFELVKRAGTWKIKRLFSRSEGELNWQEVEF